MITFRKLEHTIVGAADGKPFNLARTPENEKWITEAVANNLSAKDVRAYVKSSRGVEIAGSNKYLIFNPLTKEYFLKFDTFRSKHAIPAALVDYIETSFDKDIDFLPVLKAWARLLTNPRYTNEMGRLFATYISTTFIDKVEVARLVEEEGMDEETARNLSCYQDIAITQEGLLATYKVATMVTWEYIMEEQEDGSFKKVKNPKYPTIPARLDPTTGEVLEEAKLVKPKTLEEFMFTPAIWPNGDKFYSGDVLGYVYKVGEIQKLPENAVRNLNNTQGGGGLYIGGLNYVEGYRSSGTHVLTCFVNPSDILSFQSEGHAIRVDALMPNNVWDEDIPLKSIYHSSDYGKLSEARVDEIIKDAIERGVDLVEEQHTDSDD